MEDTKMLRNEITSIIMNLDQSVSALLDDVEPALWDASGPASTLNEDEVIALENIIEAAITMNDDILNYLILVNSNE
jgi:hypothetical protein